MAYTLDTTLGTLLNDPQAKKIIDQYLPGVTTNPMLEMAKPMTLNMVIANPLAAQFGLTKEKTELILAEINKYVK
jgi:hypothetical protein